MAWSATTILNDSLDVHGASMQVYLFPYPAGGYAGANIAAKIAALYVLGGYTDGTKKTPMTGSPWGSPDANGAQLKVKGNAIESDKMTGKRTIGLGSFEASVDMTFCDIDQAHVRDVCSVTTGEELTIALGVGQYGYKQSLIGSQRNIRTFGMIIRYLSPTVTSGTVVAYDHVLLPKVVIVPDFDLKFSRKDPTTAKIKITAMADGSLLSPDNNMPILMIHDVATGAAT